MTTRGQGNRIQQNKRLGQIAEKVYSSNEIRNLKNQLIRNQNNLNAMKVMAANLDINVSPRTKLNTIVNKVKNALMWHEFVHKFGKSNSSSKTTLTNIPTYLLTPHINTFTKWKGLRSLRQASKQFHQNENLRKAQRRLTSNMAATQIQRVLRGRSNMVSPNITELVLPARRLLNSTRNYKVLIGQNYPFKFSKHIIPRGAFARVANLKWNDDTQEPRNDLGLYVHRNKTSRPLLPASNNIYGYNRVRSHW